MKFHKALALLPFLALAQPQVAHAQQCVNGTDAAAMFVYSVPPAIEAVRNSCSGRLQNNGFIATGGNRLAARYTALQTENWPQAKRAALSLFAAANAKNRQAAQAAIGGMDPVLIFQTLPDNVARPLADALIMQKVAEQVKPEKCGEMEQVLRAMNPIEPRDAGALLGAVANLVGIENLDVCKAGGA